jgi:hypothetical protein
LRRSGSGGGGSVSVTDAAAVAGVMVTNVAPNGPAWLGGVRAGDIILQVDGDAVANKVSVIALSCLFSLDCIIRSLLIVVFFRHKPVYRLHSVIQCAAAALATPSYLHCAAAVALLSACAPSLSQSAASASPMRTCE